MRLKALGISQRSFAACSPKAVLVALVSVSSCPRKFQMAFLHCLNFGDWTSRLRRQCFADLGEYSLSPKSWTALGSGLKTMTAQISHYLNWCWFANYNITLSKHVGMKDGSHVG